MKNKKKMLFMSLSVLIIGFLMSSSSLNTLNSKALVEEKDNQYKIDSYDQFTWKWTSTEVVTTESPDGSFDTTLGVDSAGNVHVAYSDGTDYDGAGTDYDIFYKRWNASSSSWTTNEVVSTESTSNSRFPSLSVDASGNVHIAWQDLTDYAGAGTGRDIFYKRRDSSSSSWTTTEVVSTESTAESYYPSLSLDSTGNVHIAWQDLTDYAGAGTDMDIFYKRWDSSSSAWITAEVVSTESTDGSYSPSLAVDILGNIYVVWFDLTDYAGSGTDGDVFCKRWDSSSSSWTTTEVVSTESTGDSSFPSLAVDSAGDIHVAWNDYTDYTGSGTDEDIFYKRWDASFSAWITTEVVSTESTSNSRFPSLSVDSTGNVHIAWEDNTIYAGAGTDYDIFYKRWNTASSSWTTTKVVSTVSASESSYPSLFIDSTGNVHIAWDDHADYAGSGTDIDIFYRQSICTPATPELAFIVPNPIEFNTINLNWNYALRAIIYYVYRSTSYIWSLDGLLPIASVSSDDYVDTVPSEGFYYYVISAENFAGNSSHSNCQYVEVKFLGLKAPELTPILPNPTDIDTVSLVWDSVEGATEYYIYRSASYIWHVEALTPFDTVVSNTYVDSLPSEGYYYYVIVAENFAGNSSHSNCQYVEYKIPHVREFTIISSLILASVVFTYVIMRTRKNKHK